MVNKSFLSFRSVAALLFLISCGIIAAGCGTTDQARLKSSREAFLKDDFVSSEKELFTPEVFKNDQNRLMHFYLLASVAMGEEQYEKAIYFLDKARNTANTVRSGSGSFEWFSTDYQSNPIEYSYLHYLLSISYVMLAEAGQTPAWTTSEIKDQKGNVVVAGQSFPAKTYDAKSIADLRQKARAELLAWDTHLEDLKRTYPDQNFYKEDLWARVLASYIHGLSDSNNERRTAELLAHQAKDILDHVEPLHPALKHEDAKLNELFQKLASRAKSKPGSAEDHESLFVVEAGVMGKYKVQHYVLGLSTLIGQIKDPGLRSLVEQVGIRVLLMTAPEFGLIALSGAVGGAISGSGDKISDQDHDDQEEMTGPPRFLTDAIDRSFGFDIQFPAVVNPPADTTVKLFLTQNQQVNEIQLPMVSPLQELVSVEMKQREKSEMFAKAVKIGMQYLAILVPAVMTYHSAQRDGNIFKKIAAVAGFYIAKKAIDRANRPDLRSWNYLPKWIAAQVMNQPPGEYLAKITIENSHGKFEKDLGKITLTTQPSVIRKRIGNVGILNYILKP